MFDNLLPIHVHRGGPLPPLGPAPYGYCVAANGLFARGESRYLRVLFPIARPVVPLRGLAPLSPCLYLKGPPLPAALLREVVADMRRQRAADGPMQEALYRFTCQGTHVRVHRPAQQVTPVSVRCAGDGGPEVLLELHSHGRAPAFWSATDDGDELGFRLYGVVGRLDQPVPEARLRVGLYGHFYPVPLRWPFPEGRLCVANVGVEPGEPPARGQEVSR